VLSAFSWTFNIIFQVEAIRHNPNRIMRIVAAAVIGRGKFLLKDLKKHKKKSQNLFNNLKNCIKIELFLDYFSDKQKID